MTFLVTVLAVPPVGVKVNFTATVSFLPLALASAFLAAADRLSLSVTLPAPLGLAETVATLIVLLPTLVVASAFSAPAPGAAP